MSLSEFEIITKYFSSLKGADHIRVGPGDDGAVLDIPQGHSLHISTDTFAEGVHFLVGMMASDIAYRSVAAAASDLAAMGASPLGMLLAISLPEADSDWLAGFSEGLMHASAEFGLPLVGGDTSRGGFVITVTVLGFAPSGKTLTRNGASVGDRVCVSGTVGDAAAGLALLRGDLKREGIDESPLDELLQRFLRPTPRLQLGQSLRSFASSAIDISDGLLADAAHLAAASDVAIRIDSDCVPRSFSLRSVAEESQQLDWALSGGDDYELLFTLPFHQEIPEGCSQIGRVLNGSGVECDAVSRLRGYQHFSNDQ